MTELSPTAISRAPCAVVGPVELGLQARCGEPTAGAADVEVRLGFGVHCPCRRPAGLLPAAVPLEGRSTELLCQPPAPGKSSKLTHMQMRGTRGR